MARLKRSSRLKILAIALAVALMLGLAVNLPARVQAQSKPDSLTSKLPDQWEFSAPRGPGDKIPANRQGAATRDNNKCILMDDLVALVPFYVGATTAEYPTVYWYMPETSASEVNFKLEDANLQKVYSTKYLLAKSAKGMVANTPRIMSLSLPAFSNLSPLKIGQEYQWTLWLTCGDPVDASIWPSVDGKIKRVAADPALVRRISQATPQERVALYADARLWYETLSTLIELQRDQPNNREVVEALEKLLASVELNKISFAKTRYQN
ncbi:MAG: DUF928 domain-containing protein [Cyanobacteriota bacterium]|nr:DUF928 domain-containing protein [Cyanobacteriota bacterium]